MRLKRFRVTNFRSVIDSGWIDTDAVTSLIGTNESGKTNLLLPLWKLNPAKDGSIVPLADMPRKDYSTMREAEPSPEFIEADFATEHRDADELSKATGLPSAEFSTVKVKRRFDGEYVVCFPDAAPARTVDRAVVLKVLDEAETSLRGLEDKTERKTARDVVMAALRAACELLPEKGAVTPDLLDDVIVSLEEASVKDDKVASVLAAAVGAVKTVREGLGQPHPNKIDAARKLALSLIPKFVYYSNYGNLDSEIYLPHVIENMRRLDLGLKEEAKVRTLKVLFEFVGLEPDEILALGSEFKDAANPRRAPTPGEIADIAEKKKERSVLLQSASTKLTKDFKSWWKQGTYRFRFEADGDHFRIWVADEARPEEVELEGRSTGLQWFLSFYLVFLVESRNAHDDAILLLDEPGLSLHPLAQRDLSAFFAGLSEQNQLLYTTHSPFLVDADSLDRVRKVYVAKDGSTKATSDLAASDLAQRSSGYAVHAALGLTIAESLLIGCTPVLVEGPSDQIYLTAIKHSLLAAQQFPSGKEFVFPPCGGVKGVKPIVALLGGRDDVLPVVLLDGDKPGRDLAEHLRRDIYTVAKDKVLDISVLLGRTEAEVEDLIPVELISREIDRLFRAESNAFEDVVLAEKAIVPQIESWASQENVVLHKGWKVDLARRVKQSLVAKPIQSTNTILDTWRKLFERFEQS